ncbi:MAG: 30S ribosomal protein S6 [Treponema sp.]|nr:30S ribosomal protein S6 [Treponema sp.]
MRKYELMTIFPLDEEKSKKGTEDVRKVLTDFGAEITEEKLFGDRDLCYEIAKNKKGRFVLFNLNVNPEKIVEIEKQFMITNNLLKSQFVRLEDK